MPISILLVEDHNVVRQALKMLIDADPELEVIGEAADGNDALSLAVKLVPDIMIVDLMIPKLSGLEVTRQVSKKVPETKIMILTMHSDEAYVIDALRNGASAYLLKDASADELMIALHRVSEGMRYLSPSLSDRAIESYIEQSRSATSNPYDALTSREREVLHLVVEAKHTARQYSTTLAFCLPFGHISSGTLLRLG